MTNIRTIKGVSAFADLRALVPRRPLTYAEALLVAEHQASRLLEWWDQTEAPVPDEVVTELPRLKVSLLADMPVSGSSHWTGSHWQIVLRAGDHPRRRRFSLAHELKHCLDHPYREFIYAGLLDRLQEAQVERIADRFAAGLLMPKRLVISAFTSGEQDLHQLARHFDVSPRAMRIRLEHLGLSEPTPRQALLPTTTKYLCVRGRIYGGRP